MQYDGSGILQRRQFLRALGVTCIAATMAGCGGDGDSSGDGSNPDDAGNPDASGSVSCGDLNRGSQVFDPDGRQFQVVWDYPESFADVEREMANSDSLAGTRLGHTATKQPASWAFIIQINQAVNPADADAADRYVNNPVYDEATPISYEGTSVSRSTYGSGSNRTWNVAIPGDADGKFYPTTLVLGVDDSEYPDCVDAAVSVADGIMQSFRPNPAR